jgi:hypothetical protein
MPEHLRALVVVLVFALVSFAWAQRGAFGLPIAPDDFRRRRNLWFFITLLAFLSHSFWIYVAGTAVLLLAAQKKESNPLAAFLMLVFLVPPFSQAIPALGPIEQLFSIHHIRLLSLILLLPIWYSLARAKGAEKFGYFWADRFVIGYLAYQAALQFGSSTFTNGFRVGVIYGFTDVFLPYYVASRSLGNLSAYRDAVSSLATAGFILSLIAVFESSRHWLLYSTLDAALGVPFTLGNYMARGDVGVIRATASLGHSIVLGYALTIALLLFQFIRPAVRKPGYHTAGSLILLMGILAALSRGPWVGLAVGWFVLALMSKHPARNLTRFLGVLAAAGVVVLLSPYRDSLINLLPFIGETDAANIDYRQRLIDASWIVIQQNPWFGGGNFMEQLAAMGMMQGEGIVDVVNTYVGVALSQGLIGLGLFVAVFAAAAVGVIRVWRSSAASPEVHLLGRCLMAALVAMLVMIATVSPILSVPTVYWVLAGLCLGYFRLFGLRAAAGLTLSSRPTPHPQGRGHPARGGWVNP